MKRVAIISTPDMRMAQGINFVSKSIVDGNAYYSNIQITRGYSGTQTVCFDKGEPMPIGSDVGTAEYKRRRGIRIFLRKLLTSDFYPFALFKYYMNSVRGRRKAIARFINDSAPCDFIIFQDIDSAYEYYTNDKAQEIAKSRNIKTIVIIHAEDDLFTQLLEAYPKHGKKDMQRRVFAMRDFVYEHVDCVMYISKRAYNNSIVAEGKKAYVYNGVPDFKHEIREKNKDVLEFVCLGSISGWKGQEIILEAIDKMDESHRQKMHCTFVGDGSELDNLKNWSTKHGLDRYVTFLGRRNDVAQILEGKDVFVLPSIKEGLPMSALESLRAGMYLMMTNTGGCQEIVGEDCGVMVTRNPDELKEEFVKVIDGNVVNFEQKKRCRERYEKLFSLEIMSSGYENVLLSL